MRVPSRTSTTRRGAFTLVELLVVIAVIGLLIGILLPSLGAARRSGQGVVCSTNMRQIATAAMMYCDANRERFPSTMLSDNGQVPETINFWDIQAYQNAINEYIDGMQGGVTRDGIERSKRNVWFDPADPDRAIPAMWGSFSDNGLITGVGARLQDVHRPSACIYAAPRHSQWSQVVSVEVPNPLPISSTSDAFWSSEFFDMCFDPWSDSNDRGDPYHWTRGLASPPIDLFPTEPGAAEWAFQVDGRSPFVAKDQKGRYGRSGYYSFCDGHVGFMPFEATYRSPANNFWSTR